MSRIRIDDLPVVENLTPEEEELILGAGRKTFRPTLESLENREMMDAGIGAAVMQQLPSFGERAQIRLLAQETSALPNQSNPLSQSLTERGQVLMGQAQQLNANLHAAADRIFSAWSHNVDQVVQNVQALQHAANRLVITTLDGLYQGQALGQGTQLTTSDVSGQAGDFGIRVAKRIASYGDSGCSYQGVQEIKPGLFSVKIDVWRNFRDNNYDPGVPIQVTSTVTVTVKGETTAGINRLTCTNIEMSTPHSHTWAHRSDSELPHYDTAIFGGVSVDQASKEFVGTSYSAIGNQEQVAKTVYDLARVQMLKVWPGYVGDSILTGLQEVGTTQIDGGLRVTFNLNGKTPRVGDFAGHFEFDITCNQSQRGAVSISLHDAHVIAPEGMHTVFSPETLAAFQNNMLAGLRDTWKTA